METGGGVSHKPLDDDWLSVPQKLRDWRNYVSGADGHIAVPTDPVGATYAEWLESQGRMPFFEVSLPRATRLLIQYCGRLIRSEDDTGRIVLLDRRVVTRRYGSNMLRALPPFRREIEAAP